MITLNIDICPNCKAKDSVITDFTNGQVACTQCGSVLDDRIIDETSEWRNFSSENPGGSNDPNRVGGPINPYLEDINLSTTIATTKKNGILSKWSRRSIGSGNKSLHRIFRRVDELAMKLDLPLSIIDTSKDLLIKVEKAGKLKGRSLDSIIAAVFFAACRQNRAPKTINDIVQNLQLEKGEVSKAFSAIKTIIASSQDLSISSNTVGLVGTYCNRLETSNQIKKAACDIAEEVCKKEIVAGRNPSTVATASILFALNLYKDITLTKKDISNLSKTTENTIASAYQLLLINKESITPIYLRHLLSNLE
jgi:transcription initiation factor TFIIB